MSTVISVENVSKLYRLGEIGTGSLAHDVNRWWHRVRGKENPYLKIGQSNDRTSKGESDYVYALKDISFQVKQGEVLGIIGRNGAGKSTLLKILSRVTTPTAGEIKAKGRIASLLEVGTGFHPELSGRDNIFLNGAILGMRKAEIQAKFDEIVDFSGCERYIDTPVKRYSSGMYVRLAFAVAAHLESEILIVDEVLAVGDAEFQAKCTGKMKDVAGHGRTVLFVSHNMEMIERLTSACAWLSNGALLEIGDTLSITSEYASSSSSVLSSLDGYRQCCIFDSVSIEQVKTRNASGQIQSTFRQGQTISIELSLSVKKALRFDAAIVIESDREHALFTTHLSDSDRPVETERDVILTATIEPAILRTGRYMVSLALFSTDKNDFYDVIHHYPLFEISGTEDMEFPDDIRWGRLFVKIPWKKQIKE